jgi:hypothetical protein
MPLTIQPLDPHNDPRQVPARLIEACLSGSARTRLEEAVGREFARSLVDALSNGHKRREALSP